MVRPLDRVAGSRGGQLEGREPGFHGWLLRRPQGSNQGDIEGDLLSANREVSVWWACRALPGRREMPGYGFDGGLLWVRGFRHDDSPFELLTDSRFGPLSLLLETDLEGLGERGDCIVCATQSTFDIFKFTTTKIMWRIYIAFSEICINVVKAVALLQLNTDRGYQMKLVRRAHRTSLEITNLKRQSHLQFIG